MKKRKLNKELGLFDVYAISTGAMFSSGFFLLPGIAAAETGASVYLAYLASGLLMIPSMLSVAELSTAMPKAGGTYYFLDRSLGPMIGTVGGLGSWFALIFKSAFALIGMGAYLSLYVNVPITQLALILTVIFGVLNIYGAKETTLLQRILVATLLGIMTVFIIQGLSVVWGSEATSTYSEYSDFFRNGIHGFTYTIGLVIVSYAGLTKVTSVAEEVQNPDRNIPLSMILSLFTAAIIYVLGVYIMLNVLNPEEFYASLTPVADAGKKFLSWLPGSWGVTAVVVAAVAAFASTGNAGIMSASRYPFAMSRDELISPRFSKLGKTGTPSFAITVTIILMAVVLLVFDVEAVAKLASAFQLILFGLMSLAVVVMRESKIDAYSPGFRSPLYPWVQIAGMLIPVWLIAEMGLMPVSLTGIMIVLCIVWYFYYAGEKIERQGAIFHVHERLGRKRYEALEYELMSILNEKNGEDKLAYEQVVARSVIRDISESKKLLDECTDITAEIFSGRTNKGTDEIKHELQKQYKTNTYNIGKGVVICQIGYEAITTAEMVGFRINKSGDKLSSEIDEEKHTLIFLITPVEAYGLDMRLVGHLAEIVNQPSFLQRWYEAKSEKQLREVLISDEHFIHLFISENEFLNRQKGKKIGDVNLPGDCLVAIIYRDEDLIIPHGDTVLEAEDELTIIGNPDAIRELKA
ncbi:amino acid permease [Fodinibius sp. SL11]|uniref:amino acid permease n=1 Tax=Fodinibius sp. SL11 TaxID=3425690 RepID=UPI003F885BF3